ncbi:hypothetical protein KGQ19_41265 [Catenulispora sp. NL8]|uniref:Abortive infection protein n=1 Tax=Catenulispora pinistramenti TaxID=2705254 RepID=A0ABS5L590_9ACTN|nr:hypothetical protein [Catenulispora pinistramenti]MBS2553304.1 hypothetical protein [Catenulispora pinistramenti]
MRGKGINYDTGFFPGGKDSRPDFDPETARRELRIIADELHCTAVRISGALPDRLEAAAQAAAEAGLEVWFAPFPCEASREELLEQLADCARRAERIRAAGTEVVFVAGCETSLFCPGYFDGDDTYARIETLSGGGMALWSRLGEILGKFNGYLVQAAAAVREHFHGKVTYAAGPWEFIDWTPFDFVSVDAYRSKENKDKFADEIREHLKHGKPVVATEFGCTTYVGAGDRGGMGWAILDASVDPPVVQGDHVRSEDEQTAYFTELYDVFEAAGLDSAFWFTFATFRAVHVPDDPRRDLDLASYGTVTMTGPDTPELNWRRKKVFHTIAERYAAS